MTDEEIRHQAMFLIARLCLMYRLTPADLEAIGHQLAEFDAVCDYRTQGANNVTSY